MRNSRNNIQNDIFDSGVPHSHLYILDITFLAQVYFCNHKNQDIECQVMCVFNQPLNFLSPCIEFEYIKRSAVIHLDVPV